VYRDARSTKHKISGKVKGDIVIQIFKELVCAFRWFIVVNRLSMSGRRHMCQVGIVLNAEKRARVLLNCIVCRLYLLSFPADFLEFENYGVLDPHPPVSCLLMNVLTAFCFRVDSYFS